MEISYNDNEKALIFLSLFDLTPQKENELLSLFTQPKELLVDVFERDKEINNVLQKGKHNGTEHKLLSQMKEAIEQNVLSSYIANLNKRNIVVLTPQSKNYPQKLLDLEFPPQTLFCLGDISLLETQSIGVVGTRTPTPYGKIITEKFCKGLCANGFSIVSGLAAGVDSVAHKTALNNNAKTIAVLGGGFDHIFPSFNLELAKSISSNGLLLSEYRPSFQPALYTFPLRNRIIAGLSLGVLVTEAGEKSGALHTKEYALELGREVFAVPGNVNSPMSKGTNRLIRSAQCACVLDYEDIVCKFKEKVIKSQTVSASQLSLEEDLILEQLKTGEKTIDMLIDKTGLTMQQLNAQLVMLEIKGFVKSLPGNTYILI